MKLEYKVKQCRIKSVRSGSAIQNIEVLSRYELYTLNVGK